MTFAEDSNITNIQYMKLTSIAFEENQTIPSKYTCEGKNISPPLTITNVSAHAKSLVLIVDDPDAPGGTWVHWLLWNILAIPGEIPENTVPTSAVPGLNDFHTNRYGGPCPPRGKPHRYLFKLYALDITLKLPPNTAKAALEKAMNGHILDHAELVGIYQRF